MDHSAIIAIGSLVTAVVTAIVSFVRARGESALNDSQAFSQIIKTTLSLTEQLQSQNELLRKRVRELEEENRRLREELERR